MSRHTFRQAGCDSHEIRLGLHFGEHLSCLTSAVRRGGCQAFADWLGSFPQSLGGDGAVRWLLMWGGASCPPKVFAFPCWVVRGRLNSLCCRLWLDLRSVIYCVSQVLGLKVNRMVFFDNIPTERILWESQFKKEKVICAFMCIKKPNQPTTQNQKTTLKRGSILFQNL